MQLTPQLSAFDAALRAGHSVVLEAGAGCGKTTALVNVASLALPVNTLYLAFNKSVQTELASRLPGCDVKTFHSLALSNLTRRLGKLKIDANKYKHLCPSTLSYDDKSLVSDIISLFQLSSEGALVPTASITEEFFYKIVYPKIETLELSETLSMDSAIPLAFSIFIKEVSKPTAFTFDDMLWFLVHYSVVKRWSLLDYKCVVVDEAQDVSPIRLEILKRLSKRVVAVGDRRQAIYMFAGAMSNAMSEIESAFNCITLPLSVTWR